MRTLCSFIVVSTLLIGCAADRATPEPAVLTLHIAEQLHLDGQVVELERLATKLSASVEAQPTYIIYDVSPEASMAAYQEALRYLREAEVAGIRAAQTVGGFQPVVLR
ncbi:MAG: hypothetical protein AAGJ10_08955 [Bacteroidota bacterium]